MPISGSFGLASEILNSQQSTCNDANSECESSAASAISKISAESNTSGLDVRKSTNDSSSTSPTNTRPRCKFMKAIRNAVSRLKLKVFSRSSRKNAIQASVDRAGSNVSAVTCTTTKSLSEETSETLQREEPAHQRTQNQFSAKFSKSNSLSRRPTSNSVTSLGSPSPFHASILEQGFGPFCATSLRKFNHSYIKLLDETWEDWLEKYQRGDRNLSEVGRPTSFCGFGHMAPPLYRHETTRLRAVDKVNDPAIWRRELRWLSAELCSILGEHRLKAATVSLMEKTAQKLMWQTGMGHQFQSVSRDLSLDAHTLLSQGYFALLDCSNDWRTRINPLVHGPPFIKFYLGVNFYIDQVPVGCIAVSDPYLKSRVNPTLVSQLTGIAKRLSESLETSILQKLSRHTRVPWNARFPAVPAVPAVPELKVPSSGVSTKSYDSETSSLISVTVGCTPNAIVATAEKASNDSSNEELALSSTELNFGSTSLADIAVNGYSATFQPISCRSVLQPFQVFDSLLRCQTICQAIKKACRIIKHNLGADVVYLAEARLEQVISPPEAATAGNLDMQCLGPPMSKVRLVERCTPAFDIDLDQLVAAQAEPISASVQSQYGIQFSSDPTSVDPTGSGMMLPLRRKKPVVYAQTSTTPRLISRGFVMVVLHERPHQVFSPGDQAFAKKVVRALENILTCYDELNIHDVGEDQ